MLRATLLLLAVGALASACGSESSEPAADAGGAAPAESAPAPVAPAGDSPEAVFETFRDATRRNDMPTVVSLLTPESQGMMVIGLVMTASFMTMEDESRQDSLEAIFRKHISDWDEESALPDEDAGPEVVVASIADLPAFVREVSAWVDANGGDGESGFQEIGDIGEVAIQGDTASAEIETEMGPQPILFRRIDGRWLVHLPGPDEAMAGEGAPPADDGSPGLGTLWIDDRAHTLRHVVAYESTFFDEPATVILLTQRPITDAMLGKLRAMLAEGGDDTFFVSGPNLKLTVDGDGRLVALFAWAENLSINGTQGAELSLTRSGDRLSGSASMTEPGEIFESTYRFQAAFDTALVRAE